MPGSAAAAGTDGVYGRFRGDLELSGEAGAAFASGGPSFAVGLSALYLSTAGVYATYGDALGSDDPRVTRSFAGGLRIAPVFLARYALDAEHGPAHLDLLVDSIAFDVGTFFGQPARGDFSSHPGLELGLGLRVPILPRVSGPFVGFRAALRWRPQDFDAPASVADRGGFLMLTVGWRQMVRTHLVDAGDEIRE